MDSFFRLTILVVPSLGGARTLQLGRVILVAFQGSVGASLQAAVDAATSPRRIL